MLHGAVLCVFVVSQRLLTWTKRRKRIHISEDFFSLMISWLSQRMKRARRSSSTNIDTALGYLISKWTCSEPNTSNLVFNYKSGTQVELPQPLHADHTMISRDLYQTCKKVLRRWRRWKGPGFLSMNLPCVECQDQPWQRVPGILMWYFDVKIDTVIFSNQELYTNVVSSMICFPCKQK